MRSLMFTLAVLSCLLAHGQPPVVDTPVMTLAATTPEDLRLTGPDTGTVGNPLTILVHGLPSVDLSQTMGEQTAWVETLRFVISAPDGCTAELEKELAMSVSPWAWRLRLTLTPQKNGCYVVVCDWNQSPYGLALHRVTVGGAIPPDPPQPPNPDDPPATTGTAFLISVRPEQPTADQAADLLNLRVWTDQQPAGKVEFLEVTRDQQTPDGSADARVAPYVALVAASEPLPYVFLSQRKLAGGTYIHWRGPLAGNTAEIIKRTEGVLK